MIQLYLSEENFEYDVRGLLMAFYPNEEIEKIGEPAPSFFVRRRLSVRYGPQRTEVELECRTVEEAPECRVPDEAPECRVPEEAPECRVPDEVPECRVPDEAPERQTPDGTCGRECPESAAAPRVLRGAVAADLSDRPAMKNALKRAVYDLLRQDTGKTLPWGTLTGIRPTKIAMGMLEEGKSAGDIEDHMRREYYVSEGKARLSAEIAMREREILRNIDYEDGYSLYIGIPFCPTTCLYCSFTSYPLSKFDARSDDYVAAVEKELAYTAEEFGEKKLNTVYFGGGTPTTLSAGQLEELLSFVEEHFDLSWLQELTVEAGRPDSITEEKLRALRRHQVSRISVNPQTMKQATLDLIGRRHTVEQVREAFYMARAAGFENINMDLILGLPQETIDDVRFTMEELKKLRPDSITVHSLAVKRAARLNRFWEQYAHMAMENSDETMAEAAEAAASLGMRPYYLYRQKNMAGNLENVGFAAPGREGIYNILIMEEKQTIVACGAGSITKRVYNDGRIERCDNVKDVVQYIERVEEMIERKRTLYN